MSGVGKSMNNPKISVVVPSFNQARYLGLTLASIVEQEYSNLDLIVMDGGSTDGSVEIIRRYEPYISYWQSQKDGGQTAALADGFARSTGVIQCWLNSDDLHLPHTLHEVAAYFGEHPDVDAVYGDTIWIDADGATLRPQREIGFYRFLWMYTYNYIPGMSMFWRRNTYERAGGLDPLFNLAMDADLWIRMADVGRIEHVRRIWSKMRFYPEQKNVRLRDRSDEEDMRIRQRYWAGGAPRLYRIKRALARVSRIGLKAVSGCYGMGYKRDLNQLLDRAGQGEER